MGRFSVLRCKVTVLAPAALAFCASAAAIAAPVDDVRALVEAGNSGEAYTRCATIDVDAEPRADLWCGIAAVDVGRAGVGVFALERYVLRYPDDTRGRLELARAYFYAGDNPRARAEFDAVSKEAPPAPVQAGIDRYLDALRVREAQYHPTLFAYVEIGGGYDSNANAGVAQSDITLPTFGAVTVAPLGVATGSGFGFAAAGVQGTYPVAPGVAVFGSVVGTGTFYGSASEFDLANGSVAAGVSYLAGREWFALTYAHAEINVDHSRYRWSDGVGLEWRHQISERALFSVTPQYAHFSYTGNNSVRDSDYTAVAATYRQQWVAAGQPVMNLTAYFGDEHDTQGYAYLGRRLYGALADVTVTPSPPWALTASLAWVRSDYDAPYPILDVSRRDDNWALNLAAAYFFSRNWSARLEYQYARNNSNLALFEYSRNVGALKLRYEYK
jgi:hypothetical protein